MSRFESDWYAGRLDQCLDAVVRSTMLNVAVSFAYLSSIGGCWPLGELPILQGLQSDGVWVVGLLLTAMYLHGSLALLRLNDAVGQFLGMQGDMRPPIELLRLTLTTHGWLMNPFAKPGQRMEKAAQGLTRNLGLFLMINFHYLCTFVVWHSLGVCVTNERGESTWQRRVLLAAILLLTHLLAAKCTIAIQATSKQLRLDHVEGASTVIRVFDSRLWRIAEDASPWRMRVMRYGWIPGAVVLAILAWTTSARPSY